MLSSPKSAPPAPLLGNVENSQISTNQDGIVIPYFAGRRWFAMHQAQSNIYDQQSRAVQTKVGKSKQTTGYEYAGSLVGIIALGPVDYLQEIEVAGKTVWSGDIERDVDNPDHSGDIVVVGYGTFRLYWGTETQPADDLVLAGCGEDHPRYLGFCYLVVKDLLFGNNNATPPTIRVLIERAARFTGLDENRSREGANPVTALAEVLTNEFWGLGLSPDVIDLASWSATATAITRDTAIPLLNTDPPVPDYVAPMGYITPFIERQETVQAFLGRVLEHFDGWLRPTDDKLFMGHFQHDGVTPEGLPELSYHDFVRGAGPRFAPSDDDEDLITEVTIVHLDRDQRMIEVSTPCPNPAAERRLGVRNPKTIRRPYIVTTYQAHEQGNQLARHFSREEESCDVTVLREKIVGLHAGDRFVLVDAPSASSQIVRIVRRVDDADGGEVQLSLVLERGLAPLAFVPPPNPRPTLPDPELVAIANARAFQLPAAFGDYAPAPAVVLLAERPGAHVAGYNVNFSNAGLTYDELVKDGRWALRATLANGGGVTAADASFTINASGFDIAHLAAQSDPARDDDTLLLFIGFEICSIGNVTALGGGQYTVDLLRGRRGSASAAHALGAEIFIIPRSELEVLQHADFPRSTATRYFKLASYTRTEEQELADALEVSLLFDDTNVEAPGSLTALPKTEAIFVTWTYPNPPDKTIIATDLWVRDAAAPVPIPGTDVPDHSALATGFLISDIAVGATKYVWAQNRDTIGGRSALVGPVNATAAAAPAGADGDDGLPGPGVPFRGNFDGTKVYYFIPGLRRDAVYHGGQYWATNNAAKNGLATWSLPGTDADWLSYGATYSAIATGLLLAEDATILKTLVIGDGATGDAGIIRSSGATSYTLGTGFWIGTDGTTSKARFGSTSRYLRWTGSGLETVADRVELGSASHPLILDLDSDFIGPNPPARLRFGSMKASATSGGVTALDFTDGTIGVSQGYGFKVGNFLGVGTWYGVQTQTGVASFRQILRQLSSTQVWNLAGGSTEESFNVDISAAAFAAKPNCGVCNCASDSGYGARYDFDSSTATNAAIVVYRLDGANTSAGNRRFSLFFYE